jgi:uncharacterized protein (DUF2141 family)
MNAMGAIMGSISASGTGFAAPTAESAASRAPRLGPRLGLCLLALGLLPGAAPLATLDVEIAGLRSAKGVIQLCLTADPASYPDCKKGHAIKRTVPASAPHIHFADLAPGSYAIAVIHDENSNAKLDTFMGIPREGFGFSRNPGIGFGPPGFKAVQFDVGGDAARQQVKIRYLL